MDVVQETELKNEVLIDTDRDDCGDVGTASLKSSTAESRVETVIRNFQVLRSCHFGSVVTNRLDFLEIYGRNDIRDPAVLHSLYQTKFSEATKII